MVKCAPARGERGQILVLTAVSMTMLLGIAALSIDASFMYDKRNRLYAAADAAAKIAAMEVHRGNGANMLAFAQQQVVAHGFALANVTLTVRLCNAAGATCAAPFAGSANYVEAVVSEATSTFFARVLGVTSLTPGARAVAGTRTPLNCLILLAPPGSPQSLSIGNTTLTLNSCGVGLGGGLAGNNPNAEINGIPTPSVEAAGTCTGTCGRMGTLTQNGAAPVDPLAGLAAPTVAGACVAGVAATLSPGCYSSIATSVTTLNAGIYKVTGTVDVNNLSGTNVMIYLVGAGKISSANNKTLTLTAPTSGTYAGIAIFQDPADTNNFESGNHFTLNVTGAIYMPGSDVIIANHISFNGTGCSLFVGHSLSIGNGDGGFSSAGCAALYDSAAFLSVAVAE